MESPSLMKFMEHLECQICTEIFDETERKPKMLPCQHTICLHCMNQIARRDDTRLEYTGTKFEAVIVMKCPTCNAEHEAPDNDVDKFQNNITMIAFLSVAPKGTSKAARGATASPLQRRSNDDNSIKKCLSETVQRLRDKIAEAQEGRVKKISSMEAEVDKAKKTIRTHCKQFKQAIELREAQLVAKLDDFNATYQNTPVNAEFQQQLGKMNNFCDAVDKQLKASTERKSAKNLDKCLEMIEKIETLNESDHGETNGNRWLAKFNPDRKDTVHASIAMFGQLILLEPGAVEIAKKRDNHADVSTRRVYSRAFLLGVQTKLIASRSGLDKPRGLIHFPDITESMGIGHTQRATHTAMIENHPLTLNLINCIRRQPEAVTTEVPYEAFTLHPSHSPYDFEDDTPSRDYRRSPPDGRHGSATLTYLRNAALADCESEDDDWRPPRLTLGADPLLLGPMESEPPRPSPRPGGPRQVIYNRNNRLFPEKPTPK